MVGNSSFNISCTTIMCLNGGHCKSLSSGETCSCPHCYTGLFCENHGYILTSIRSALFTNLYLSDSSTESTTVIYGLILAVLLLIGLTNNVCSLQTFLGSRKIRLTSIGIYLSIYSVCSLFALITLDLTSFIIFDSFRLPLSYEYFACNISPTICMVMAKFSLWISACIALERFLIEFLDIRLLFGSRYRPVCISFCVFLLVASSHAHYPIYRRAVIGPGIRLCHFDAPPVIKRLENGLELVHHIGPCLIHLVTSVGVLGKLIRRKVYLQPRLTYWRVVTVQLRKHINFFIPPILIAVSTLPHVVVFHFMDTCRFSVKLSLLNLRSQIVFIILSHFPQLFTFFIYVYPSNLYRGEFCRSSVGRMGAQVWHYLNRKYLDCLCIYGPSIMNN